MLDPDSYMIHESGSTALHFQSMTGVTVLTLFQFDSKNNTTFEFELL
jgi:hypothetical protein